MSQYLLFPNSTHISVNLATDGESLIRFRHWNEGYSDCACTPDLQRIRSRTIFGFTNRDMELNQIFNPGHQDSSRTLIDAPAGYGKTEMLYKLYEMFKDNGWLPAFVDLGDCQGRGAIRKSISTQFRIDIDIEFGDNGFDRELKSQISSKISDEKCRIVLLIDSIENAYEKDIVWFRDTLMANWIKSFPQTEFRVIFAGRYIRARGENKWSDSETKSLSPFSVTVVEKLIRDTATVKNKASFPYRDWAKRIVRLSGGHPRSIQHLVSAMNNDGWVPIGDDEEEKELFIKCKVDDEIDKATESIPPNIQEWLRIISVFRILHLNIIQRLQQEDLLPKDVDASNGILQLLVNVGLVKKNVLSAFYSDKIIRRILITKIRLFDPNGYRKFNEVAASIFINMIKAMPKDHIDYRNYIEIFVIESIYHHCQQVSQNIVIGELASSCLQKHGSILIDCFGEDSTDPDRKKHLNRLIQSDREIKTYFEDRGIMDISLMIPDAINPNVDYSKHVTYPLVFDAVQLKGEIDMTEMPALISAIVAASKLLYEIGRDVFASRQAQSALDVSTETSTLTLPITKKSDQVEALLDRIQSYGTDIHADNINSLVTQLQQHKRNWNDFKEEEAKLNASSRGRVETKQLREDEEAEIKQKSSQLKQLLEQIPDLVVNLTWLE